MATWTGLPQTNAILGAAEAWKTRCLLANGSILASNEELWSKDNLDSLRTLFVDNPIEGDRPFYEKLKEQISTGAPQVKKLASECLWLALLFVHEATFSPARKRERILEIWRESSDAPPTDSPPLNDEVLRGLARPGAAFLTMLWLEYSYLLNLLSAWKALPRPQQEELLANNPWGLCQWATRLEGGDVRAFRHMFLYFCYPAYFERICSRTHKRRLYAQFSGLLQGKSDPYANDRTPCGLDKSILEIRHALEREYKQSNLDFYVPPLRERWGKSLTEAPEPEVEPALERRYWVEKTIVEGRQDRMEGPHRLGEALWSPQRSADGRDIYSSMRQVAADDVVLHLTDNSAIAGISRVAAAVDPTFQGVAGTAWGEQPSLRVQLKDHVTLEPELPRASFFEVPELARELRQILTNHDGRGLFYNRDLDLNQGAYLTEAPRALVGVLDRAYVKITGRHLPYVDAENTPNQATEALPFTVENAAEELFIDLERIERILAVWNAKHNLILEGPPGVGKTFAARRLAHALIGSRSADQLGFVQFHQSYSYEDFIQGYRPSGNGFSLRDGVFYRFCQRASQAPDTQKHVFIVDEINRGNLSRIFGELLLLLESDKRGKEWAMPLVYSGDAPFYVPKNVYLLGLMNTADRSLAVIDYALRRRFAFEELVPQFDAKKFETHLKANQISDRMITTIRQRMTSLNDSIAQDTTNLGRGFCIGHSFFCRVRPEAQSEAEWYRSIIETEIMPLLREYWFDSVSRVQEWQQRLLESG